MNHKDRTTRTINTQKISNKTDNQPTACQTCGQLCHSSCVEIAPQDIYNYTCLNCQPRLAATAKKAYLAKEQNDPPFMTRADFILLCLDIKRIERGGPKTLCHKFKFDTPAVTWELLAGSSAHSYACNEAGYPPPSVVVEKTKTCDPVLRANCGPTLHHIFRYIQSGHQDSMPLPSQYASHYLKMKSRTRKEQGRKKARTSEKYTLDLMIACLICTPYSRMGLQNGFNQGAGRAFCEVLRVLADTPTNVGMTEQCVEFTTADSGKVFSLFLNCLVSLQYEIAWRIHNTSHGGMPQDRKRVYIIYIKKPGPSPDFLMDLQLSPTDKFRRTQEELNRQREFPPPERLVQFPLHQTKFTTPMRTDGKTGAILTGPRRTAFAAQYKDPGTTAGLTTFSGPIHVSNLLSLQELPQHHLSAAPSLNAQYLNLGNSCSGQIALQQVLKISEAVNAAITEGRSSYSPTLTQYTTQNIAFKGSLAQCMHLYCQSPNQYKGACTDLQGQWILMNREPVQQPPMCTLPETITRWPIGTRRQLDHANFTFLTPREAAHILYRSMDTLSSQPWLIGHLYLAAGQAYYDRLDQEDKSAPDRDHGDPEEIEDINEWTRLFTSIMQQHEPNQVELNEPTPLE